MSDLLALPAPDAADDDAPISARDDTWLAQHIRDCLREFDTGSRAWAAEAREAYDFVAGHQWSDEDLEKLTEQNRPAITFNRVGPLIDAVCGSQVNNRLETRYLPRTIEDGGSSEILGGVLAWVRDGCDAEDHESDAFRDAAICGLGWLEWRPDYTYDQQGKLVCERCDPFEMAWDLSAQKVGLADLRWVARRRRFSEDEVLARWPDARAHIMAERGQVGEGGVGDGARTHPVRDQYARADEASRRYKADGVEVVQYEWCEYETAVMALDPADGRVKQLTAAQWAALGERFGEDVRDQRIRHVRQTRKQWWKAILIGHTVMERGYTPDPQESSFHAITGKRDQNTGDWYGLVRAVMDPQRWANKWLAQGLHIVNTSANSGVIAEETTIPDERKFEESFAKPGAISKVADGALSAGRIQPKTPPPFPPALQQGLQFALMSINEVSGINKEMLGIADREQAGVLEWQRKQAAQAVIAPLFDSMRRYYKSAGRSLLVMVRQYISPQKVLRIMGPNEQPQAIQAAMVPDVAQYDIVVDQAPTSPNQKMETWAIMQPMLPVLMRALPPQALLPFLRYSPLPESAVREIEQAVAKLQQQQGPPPEVQKMQAELQMKQAELQMQQQAEMAKAQQEMQIMREKHALEMQIERERAMLRLELDRMRANAQVQASLIRASNAPATVQ